MNDKDKIIACLRKHNESLRRRLNALEQENALLSYQLGKIGEEEFFSIPDYGTDEWADWMIEISQNSSENYK